MINSFLLGFYSLYTSTVWILVLLVLVLFVFLFYAFFTSNKDIKKICGMLSVFIAFFLGFIFFAIFLMGVQLSNDLDSGYKKILSCKEIINNKNYDISDSNILDIEKAGKNSQCLVKLDYIDYDFEQVFNESTFLKIKKLLEIHNKEKKEEQQKVDTAKKNILENK